MSMRPGIISRPRNFLYLCSVLLKEGTPYSPIGGFVCRRFPSNCFPSGEDGGLLFLNT